MFEDRFGNKVKPKNSPEQPSRGETKGIEQDYIIGGSSDRANIGVDSIPTQNLHSEYSIEPIGISPDSINRGYEGFGQDNLSAVVESEVSAITKEDFIDIPMSEAEKAEALKQNRLAGNQDDLKEAA